MNQLTCQATIDLSSQSFLYEQVLSDFLRMCASNIGGLLCLLSCCMSNKLLLQCTSFFTAMQLLVGIFWPSMMKLRSQYVPEGIRATTLNLFRVPLNLFVCLVLYNVRPLLSPKFCIA